MFFLRDLRPSVFLVRDLAQEPAVLGGILLLVCERFTGNLVEMVFVGIEQRAVPERRVLPGLVMRAPPGMARALDSCVWRFSRATRGMRLRVKLMKRWCM